MRYKRMFILVIKTTILSLLWLALQGILLVSNVLADLFYSFGRRDLYYALKIRDSLENGYGNLQEEIDRLKGL